MAQLSLPGFAEFYDCMEIRKINSKPVYKPLSKDFHGQYMEQGPVYRAGFALDITLDRMGTIALIGWLLVAASVIAGGYYGALGIVALKHLPHATEQDRVVGWSLWWFLESDRYDDAGQRLCKRGGAIFALAWALAIPGYYLALRR